MIWKETGTRRGLRRPSEPKKKGKRTLINLSETFGGSGNPRAGGSYDNSIPTILRVIEITIRLLGDASAMRSAQIVQQSVPDHDE